MLSLHDSGTPKKIYKWWVNSASKKNLWQCWQSNWGMLMLNKLNIVKWWLTKSPVNMGVYNWLLGTIQFHGGWFSTDLFPVRITESDPWCWMESAMFHRKHMIIQWYCEVSLIWYSMGYGYRIWIWSFDGTCTYHIEPPITIIYDAPTGSTWLLGIWILRTQLIAPSSPSIHSRTAPKYPYQRTGPQNGHAYLTSMLLQSHGDSTGFSYHHFD